MAQQNDDEEVSSLLYTSTSLSIDWEKLVSDKKGASFDMNTTSDVEFIIDNIKKEKYHFITGSSYKGEWNALGLCGFGNYTMPHGVEYEGQLQENMFYGTGSLIYPMGQQIRGTWDKGYLRKFKFVFPDGLEYYEPWKYCQMPDRRFYNCIKLGLFPPGLELRTNDLEPRQIPKGCYDTGDGFYNPKTKCVTSAIDKGKVIRIVTSSEEKWIINNCRREWDEPTGYRPDLYEKWLSGRISENVDDYDSIEMFTQWYHHDELKYY